MMVAAAIVAYNKVELLKLGVSSLRTQTHPPDEIIIINNESTDGTAEWLAEQEDLFVVHQPNSGSAGGFFSALKIGYERKHDWIFCMDDDVVLLEDTLEKLLKSPHSASSSTGFLCCRVVDPERRTYMTPMPTEVFPRWYDSIGESMCIRVGEACWAGLMINREAIRRCGLPIREFFTWEEDREYSERVARKMPCYCVLDSVVVHYQGKVLRDSRVKQLHQARNKFARVIISDIPTRTKAYYIAKYCGWLAASIIVRKYPLRCLMWAVWGLFAFRPKIQFIDN
jgi:GT2 family glycosyltransferase